MNKICILIALTMISVSAVAQKGSNDRQFKGEIIHLDGSVTQGYVELNGSDKAPWSRQQDVRFFMEGALADGKIKNNEKTKYNPKDILGYQLEDGRKWITAKVGVMKLESGIGLNKNQFIEVVIENEKFSYYKLYTKPETAGALTTDEQRAAREEYLEGLRNDPSLVVINRMGENEYAVARKFVWSKYMGNCPDMLKEYEMGKMGVNAQDEGKSSIANLTSGYEEDLKIALEDIINAINSCK